MSGTGEKPEKESMNEPMKEPMKENCRVALVLLAAGDSRRFGGNKLLTLVGEKTMYRHLVDEIAALPEPLFFRKLVVSQYPEILEDLKREGYETVENRESHLGISHSIHLALERMDGTEDGVCFAVCDQPFLKGETVAELIRAWIGSEKGMGCLCFQERDGNPAVFARKYEPALAQLTGDVGGKRIIRQFPQDVFRLEVESERELEDMDTRL